MASIFYPMVKSLVKETPLSIYLFFSVYVIIFLSVSRIALALWLFDRVQAVNGWLPIIFQGLKVDIVTLGFLLVLPMLYSSVSTNSSFSTNNGKKSFLAKNLIRTWLTLIAMSFVFMELVTSSFFQEYNIRPNRLFIEYLFCPKEVFGMLIKNKLPVLLNSSFLTIVTGYFVWKWIAKKNNYQASFPDKKRPLITLIIFVVAFLGGRSTLVHQPISSPMGYFSNDLGVNSLALNSLYSVLWSTKQLLSEASLAGIYCSLSVHETIKQAREFNGCEAIIAGSISIPSQD